MSAGKLDGIVRRRLVVVAVDGYEDGQEGFKEGIATQVERITRWLADPELGNDRRFEVVRAEQSPSSVDDLRAFLHGQNLAAASYKEAVVVYITGHGMRRLAQRHYLMLPKTKEERLLATAFPTSELITAVLDSQSEHVMVLVDSCHSGTLRAELGSLFQDLSDERHKHKGTAVITAGDHYEKPLVGSFTRRVALACERMRDEASGYTGSHLSFAEWEQLLHQVGLDDEGVEKELISAEWIVPHSRGRAPSACLPNPRYQPVESVMSAALRQLMLDSGPLEEFWLERASGRAGADDPGWYFSGRAEPMARMVTFVREGAGVLVVTGAAGSGKSALLARLVTLADGGFAADPKYAAMVAAIPDGLRPDPGAVNVAVLVRNKSARVVVEELLSALGGIPDGRELPLQTLLRLLAERASSGAVSIVIDALDEAEDPLACVGDLIVPLSRLTTVGGAGRAVRLVVGVRSSPVTVYASGTALQDERADQLLQKLVDALRTEDAAVQVLRTDGPDCTADIASYTVTLLCAPRTSPYHGAPEAAETAARHIAEAVAPSFLDARIAADQLRTAPVRQSLDEADWLRRLADGTTGLLRDDIQAVATATGISAGLLVTALRATAFAPGAGLPWAEVWPAVTAALAAAAYGPGYADPDAADRAIRTLRSGRLTGYLATAEEDARTVYRPVHQRLTDLLLTGHDWLSAPALPAATENGPLPARPLTHTVAQAAITRALANLVERARPHLAHPYVRRHFLHHAAAGDILTDREVPLELLAQETSGTLRAHLALPLPAGDPERRNLTAAALIEPYADAGTDYASRLGSIAFHRGIRGLGGTAEAPSALLGGLPVAPSWGRWAPRVNVLAPSPGHTNALCAVPTLDGRQLIAVAAEAGGVRIWDARTGRHVADLDTGPVQRLRTILANGGRTFLITLGQRDVRIYDPVSGQRIAQTPLPRAHDVHVLADGPALWKLCVLTSRGAYVWRPRANRLFEAPGFPEDITREYDRGQAPFRRLTAVVRRRSGEALVAACREDGIRLWNPVSGAAVGPTFGGSQVSGVVGMARPDNADDDLLIAESPSPLVLLQVWNPFTAQPVARTREGGSTAVAGPGGTAFAYVARNRIVLQSVGTDSARSFDAGIKSVDALAVLEDPAGPRVVSAGPQGIRIWDPGFDGPLYEDGLAESVYRGPSLEQHRRLAPTWSVCRSLLPATGEAPGGSVLVLATRSGLDVHSATTGNLLKRLGTGLVSQVLPLVPAGTRVAVSDPKGDLSIWDLISGHMVMTGPKDLSQSVLSSCVAWTAEGLPMSVSMGTTGHIRELTSVVLDPENGRCTASTVPISADIGESPIHLLGALPPSPSGDVIVVAGVGQEAVLIDVASGRRAGALPRWDHRGGHGSVLHRLHGDSGPLLVMSNGTHIGVWDVATRTRIAAWESPDTFAMSGLPAPDGHTLLVSGGASGVRIWDPRTGDLVHTVLTGAPVHGIATGEGASGTVLHLYGPAGLATLSVDTRLL